MSSTWIEGRAFPDTLDRYMHRTGEGDPTSSCRRCSTQSLWYHGDRRSPPIPCLFTRCTRRANEAFVNRSWLSLGSRGTNANFHMPNGRSSETISHILRGPGTRWNTPRCGIRLEASNRGSVNEVLLLNGHPCLTFYEGTLRQQPRRMGFFEAKRRVHSRVFSRSPREVRGASSTTIADRRQSGSIALYSVKGFIASETKACVQWRTEKESDPLKLSRSPESGTMTSRKMHACCRYRMQLHLLRRCTRIPV